MYKYTLHFICCITMQLGFAQNNSGTILYEEKVDVHKNLPEHLLQMKDEIPQFVSTEKLLHFNTSEAFYISKPKEEKEEQTFQSNRHRRMMMRMSRSNNNEKYYTNFEEGISIDERAFFGKDFLITGTRESLNWKITGEQKQVGQFLCQKAVFKDTITDIVAWFTPMIPVSTGPADYFGLPGVILHVDIDEGSRTLTAIDIDLKVLDEGLITKPTKGEKVSHEEFEKIREEKRQEMKEMNGGRGGNRFMRPR